ncbi:type IV secretory system conjugative DNA transfer family protein [Streptomyces chumphonensis]|uniref:Type VI secretion protein n=1 Tax=Streptomyces chumphonensis TaxID=1214925 RepID=A0A927ID57_9ACTN|nr:type VI secretion protein [Streptomyces chumphonensis]MBD3934753.1 type VI secretion protein [Streptomyces chumphonensis]
MPEHVGPVEPTGPGRKPGGGVPDGLLVGLLGLLLSVTVLAWTALGLAGLLTHGAWPQGVSFPRTPLALRALVTDPANLAAAWPEADPVTLPGPGLFWGLLIGELMVLCVLALAASMSLARRRARRRVGQLARDAAGDDPGATEHSSRTRRLDGTSAGLPPAKESPLRSGVAHQRERPARSTEGTVPSVPGPQGPGTPSAILLRGNADPAEAISAAEGPVVVVTADPLLWADTVAARGKLGPAFVYDPNQVTDAPVRLRWAPQEGCADPAVARRRAAALLAPVRSPASGDVAVHEAAETLLRCCLHAADISGKPFKSVHRWATGTSTADAVRVLRRHADAASGAAGELEATLTGHAERRDMASALIDRALAALRQVHVRNTCAGARNDSVALESFGAEMGTLYIVGAEVEAPRRDAGVVPLVTALTSSVVEHGRRMAARSSSGRLDPPMTVVLDNPAAVAPLADLPALLTEGEELGIHTLAYVRSTAQARTSWPHLAQSHLARADATS